MSETIPDPTPFFLEAALIEAGRMNRVNSEMLMQLHRENRALKNRVADLERQNTSLLDRLNEHWGRQPREAFRA